MVYSPCRVLLVGLCFVVVYKDYSSFSPPILELESPADLHEPLDGPEATD